VKERCDRRFVPLSRGGVYYAFLFQSQPLFQKFFSGDSGFAEPPDRADQKPLCRVSGGAL
ncbi:hypothetical protein C3402_12215, partial [Pantoea sp. PSNIH3]